ncbi:MAG: DUF4190 domain-containing protein [Acidobacteria bacterium]|nr:DUF4190 domain-containing protein [Acidobacteriota bacterium]
MSQPIYSPPPPPAPPASASASSQAITALVLGILGVICCGFAAPFAWYFGQTELRAIREGRSSTAGEGMAMAGKILGIIGTVLLIFGILWVLFFGGMAVLQGFAHR